MEHLARDGGDGAHLRPFDSRNRIEIDAQLVWMIQIVGAYRMRMQLQACQVREPCERGGFARHDLVGCAARRKAQGHDFDPWRARLRRSFLIERRRSDPVRVADEHVGPITRAAQRAVGDSQIVVREIQLGVLRFREEDLGGVRDGHVAPADAAGGGFSCFRARGHHEKLRG